MTTVPYTEIIWEEPFHPLSGSQVLIPPHTILWRGYDTSYPSVSSRPAYFSSKDIANRYIRNPDTHTIGCFMTTQSLKILDIRFMRTLLARFIQMYPNDAFINDFGPLMISLGLCSLGHQIKLMKTRYTNSYKEIQAQIENMESHYKPDALIEQVGIRVGETTNDGRTMIFLQELFKHTFDGFISPRMSSYFHTDTNEELHPELILFNPSSVGIIELTNYPNPIRIGNVTLSGERRVSIMQFMKDRHQLYTIKHTIQSKPMSFQWFASGGSSHLHPLDKYDELVRTNPVYAEYEEVHRTAGKRWNAKLCIFNTDHAVPTCKVSPWPGPSSDIEVVHLPPREGF